MMTRSGIARENDDLVHNTFIPAKAGTYQKVAERAGAV